MIELVNEIVDTLKEFAKFQRIVVLAFGAQLLFDVIVLALVLRR